MENAPYQKLLTKGHITLGAILTLGVFILMSFVLRQFTFSTDPVILHWGFLAISGSKGSLEVRRIPYKNSCYELILHRINETKAKRQIFGTGLSKKHDALEEAHVARDLLDFVEAVSNNRPPLASAEDAAHCIEIIEAAEQSAQIKSAIEIPVSANGKKGEKVG